MYPIPTRMTTTERKCPASVLSDDATDCPKEKREHSLIHSLIHSFISWLIDSFTTAHCMSFLSATAFLLG